MHTGRPTPQVILNEDIFGKIVLDPTAKHDVFPALNVSNNFATINYDAHTSTKLDYTVNRVFSSMTVQALNTLHTICELERNQFLTKPAIPVQNPQLRFDWKSNFFSFMSNVLWLYDCPHFLSPFYEADCCFDRRPKHHKATLIYM